VAAITDRGVALAEMERFDEALTAHERALAIEPHVLGARVNRGNALLKLGRLNEALDNYTAALAIEPDNADANFNAAVTRLCQGDLRQGFKQYEYRWQTKALRSLRPDYPQPMWNGERNLHGKTVLLLHEQGLGDALQFVRYAPLVAALGARVLLAVPSPLKLLMASLPGDPLVLTDGQPVPDFDLYCPLMSLPLAFGTELATVPASIPYLRPYQERLDKWRARLPDNGRLRIGLCWAGSKGHMNDRSRSIPLQHFARLLSVPGLDFISVQKDVSDADAAILRERGVAQLGRDFEDFCDTAAVVAMLDLVITVDTSVAHLAGAMGNAVALLVAFSPDWRWMLNRTDSPWYPTVRLFRQTSIGDWDGALARLRQELADLSRRPMRPR
jgi:hypothetical protein